MLPIFKKLTILAIGAALVGGAAVTIGSTTASAAVTSGTHAVGLKFAGGAGHAGEVWAGTWKNGVRGFCLDFGSTTPNTSGTAVITGFLPGWSNLPAERSKQAKFIANKYAATTSNESAANAGLAIWSLKGGTFNTWYRDARTKGNISVARDRAVTAIKTDAQQHANYSMGVRLTQVMVGQTGSGTVTVMGSNGKPAVNRKVYVAATSFTGGNAGRLLSVNNAAHNSGYTGSTGVVTFKYQRATTGMVGFKATLSAPSSATAGVSTTSNGHQRTISGGYTETAVRYASYNRHALLTITGKCSADCNGESTVTFKASNPVGAQNLKWTMKNGATTVAVLDVKPGTTGTLAKILKDGTRITTSSYCYTAAFKGTCLATAIVRNIGFTVVCPAWVKATIQKPCNCNFGLPVSVTFTSLAGSPRFYRGYVNVNGAVVARDLVNGIASTITTAKLGKNSNVVVSFTIYSDAARTKVMSTNVLESFTVY